MKKFLFAISLLITCAPVRAQQTEEKIVAYFDAQWKRVYDSTAEISYYRTVVPAGDHFTVKDYWVSGVLQMKAECSKYLPEAVIDGKAIFYYENGKLKKEGTYKNDKERGVFQEYYESGKLCKEMEYTEQGDRYLQAYDENGKELLIKGNGLIPSRVLSAWSYSEIEDHKIRGSYFIEDNTTDTVYAKTDIHAEYKGGLQQMKRDVGKNLRYPEASRKLGLQGTVFVHFVIDKEGSVGDVEVLRGVFRDCNDEAVRVVALLNNWKPARHRGKIVKSAFVLPVSFKLER